MSNNKIKIDDESIIDFSDGNYVLKYRIENTSDRAKNKYRWEIAGYFTCIEDAMIEWIDSSPLRTKKKIESMKNLIEYIEGIKKHTVKIVKKI